MSSMRNHIKRSHRSEGAKRGVFSVRSYKAVFRPQHEKKDGGIRALLRAVVGKHAGARRRQRETQKQVEA